VARLAVQLFDLTRPMHRLSAPDRAILSAAARLHDVGFATDPRHHRLRSAQIVRHFHGQGIPKSQRALLAATILFHGGDVAENRQHPWVASLPDPERAAKLGAFLRIADGLDFGHIQDAVIVSARCGQNKICIRIRSPLFPANLDRARQKADLWQEVFPVGIELIAAASGPAALLSPDTPLLEAARRMVMRQWKLATINAPGAVPGQNSECLHDFRVAVRRLRVVLRAFRKPLAPTPAEEIDRALRRLNRALGPVRDWDVWIEFLTTTERNNPLAGNSRWAGFCRFQRQCRQLQQSTVRRHLSGPAFSALQRKLSRFSRLELPHLATIVPSQPLPEFAMRAFSKNLRRALKLAKLRHSTKADKLHQLRIALRKARYLGEFFAPVLGPPVDKLTRRIHAVERVLATIHDTDLYLARITTQGPPPPRWLGLVLAERRQETLSQIEPEWSRLKVFLEKPVVRRKLKT
jgi:CHAD domain-containing protein